MPKKTIHVKQVLQDIKAGMHDNALMNKYGLSPGQLKSLMTKLEQAGLIEPPAPVEALPPDGGSDLYGPFFTCPACGLGQPGEYDECPRCGVVVAKYQPPPEQPTGPDSANSAKAKVEFGGWAQTQPRSHQGIKILVAIVALAIAVVLMVMVNRYKEAKQQQAQQNQVEQLSTTSDQSEEDLSTRAPHRYRDLIDRRLPHVKPVNPELDSLLRKSMGRIGDALDERDKAREDLTNKP